MKLVVIIYIGYKIGLISKELLLFVPNRIKKIIEVIKNQEDEVVNIIDELPFVFRVPKSRSKKRQIRIPKWLKTLIPILGINKLTKNQLEEIIIQLAKGIKSSDQNDQNDKKLIESILNHLKEIQNQEEED